MFSPYYLASGRHDPLDHCAINLCLYGAAPRWTMTERGRASLARSARELAIGPSRLFLDSETLVAEIAEQATPIPRAARGTIRIVPEAIGEKEYPLDPAGRHIWRSPAPAARVEVQMAAPHVSWSGHGYVDMNWGSEPLEAGFRSWHWSRSRLRDGSAVFFDGECRAGDPFALALRFDREGRAEPLPVPPSQPLPRTNWLLQRRTGADPAAPARLVRTLEDTPFYARSILAKPLFGEVAPTMHESLDLDRFASRWVQTLLPYRMPRRTGPSG